VQEFFREFLLNIVTSSGRAIAFRRSTFKMANMRWLFALLACVALAAAGARASSVPDAFLDLPLRAPLLPPYDQPPDGIKPSRTPEFHCYATLARAIKAVSPKPVIFPPGWLAFVSAHEKKTDWDNGKDFFLHGKPIISVFPPITIRCYLGNLFGQTGLSWKYDPQRDAIVTDFPWRADDPRDGSDLLKVLLTTKPTPLDGFKAMLDPWTHAFNALLNKPENYPRAWPLRFCADDRSFIFATERIKLLDAGTIRDSAGGEHIILVNDQPEFCNPGPPGSFSYYLFNRDGHFENGGICTIGYRCFADSAWLDADGRHLAVRVYNNGRQRRDSTFVLENGQLKRTDFLIEGLPPTTWQWCGLDSGKTIFTASGG
jgi:hypothetical protein